jgi:hypothetical protein
MITATQSTGCPIAARAYMVMTMAKEMIENIEVDIYETHSVLCIAAL